MRTTRGPTMAACSSEPACPLSLPGICVPGDGLLGPLRLTVGTSSKTRCQYLRQLRLGKCRCSMHH